MTHSRAKTRAAGACLTLVAAFAFGACSRAARGPSRPRPTIDSARVAAPPGDTATPRTPPVAVPDDSIARDTARAAANDSARPAPRARRRNANDPTSRCGDVTFTPTPTTHATSYTDAAGQPITYIGGGVIANCSGVRNRLQSDSAEYYGTNRQLILLGNVKYDEPRRARLTSNRLTYFTSDERILAEGNVVVTMPTGTTMTGPNVEYLRDAPAIRDRARLTAIGRPTLRVVTTAAKDTGSTNVARTARGATRDSAARDTATIIANTIVDEGDSLIFASGQVEVVRSDVRSRSDSATFDQGAELARLIDNAEIIGQRGRPFTLSGTRIDLYSRDRELTRVRSQGASRVVSDDLDLKSDTIDLRVRDSRIERAFAWGPSRAIAVSPDRDVVADSIDAQLPNQRIRELHAVRRAVVRSLPDSTKIVSKERDRLAGDTIVARFDTLLATQDTTKNPPLRQIVASGNASSLFQIASTRGREAPQGFNYVQGRLITAVFDSGQLQTVTVVDSARGLYLEAVDSTADTTGTRTRGLQPARQPTPARRPTQDTVHDRSLVGVTLRDRSRSIDRSAARGGR